MLFRVQRHGNLVRKLKRKGVLDIFLDIRCVSMAPFRKDQETAGVTEIGKAGKIDNTGFLAQLAARGLGRRFPAADAAPGQCVPVPVGVADEQQALAVPHGDQRAEMVRTPDEPPQLQDAVADAVGNSMRDIGDHCPRRLLLRSAMTPRKVRTSCSRSSARWKMLRRLRTMDGRFSGGSHGFIIGHVVPEAQEGGPIALIQNGDVIMIDAASKSLTIDVSDEEMARRRAAWQMPPYKAARGTLYKYIKNVKNAAEGCVTDE